MGQYRHDHIDATTLQDLWFQAIYKLLEIGIDFTIDRGSYAGDKRLEFDWFTATIRHPNTPTEADRIHLGDDALLPRLSDTMKQAGVPDPVPDPIANYLPYIMTPAIEPNEAYTYGQRLWAYPIPNVWFAIKDQNQYASIFITEEEEVWENQNIVSAKDSRCGIDAKYGSEEFHEFVIYGDSQATLNQVELLIWTYKNKGYRNNQMVLAVEHPLDMLLQDPPCLRKIDTRIQDGKLHFIVSFRSWDLWGGLPANLAALVVLQEYIASSIGVDVGTMNVECKGLHIYKFVWALAEQMRGKTIEAFRREVEAV